MVVSLKFFLKTMFLLLLSFSAFASPLYTVALSEQDIYFARKEVVKMRKTYKRKDKKSLATQHMSIVDYQLALQQVSSPLIAAAKEIAPDYAYDVRVIYSPSINAYTDGNYIVVTTGIMNFVDNDDELAFVVAHEMAHNILHQRVRHIDLSSLSHDGNVVLLNSVGHDAEHKGHKEHKEHEADFMGLEIMQKAGYNIERAPALWKKLAVQVPETDAPNPTHPTSSMRFAKSSKVVDMLKSSIVTSEVGIVAVGAQ